MRGSREHHVTDRTEHRPNPVLDDPMARQPQPRPPQPTPRRVPQEGELARHLAESFTARLRRRWQEGRTLLCVGLDVELERIPEEVRQTAGKPRQGEQLDEQTRTERVISAFTAAIVDATADLVCAYKPNIAFYEQYGPAGLHALSNTIGYIQERHPDIPVLLDAKRGDIGSTSEAYARAIFDVYGADAVTLQPYLGRDALEPFLRRANRGAFILCRTSNPGAGELQDLRVRSEGYEDEPLYIAVARLVASSWNANRNCGLVVGATYPDELRAVRAVAGDLPILVPGLGAQGGELAATVRAGLDSARQGLILSASRSVLYASSGPDFASAARREAARLRIEIERLRAGPGESGILRKLGG
jgi:orotidine-5'-phosphate decarboxylase